MWAGCIWVPIYEVMTRKHLTMVTLEENLEMAADIGMDATTSIDEAFGAAMERHGSDARVIVLPFARYHCRRTWCEWTPSRSATRKRFTRTDPEARSRARCTGHGAEAPAVREIRGSTTVVELLRMFPDGEAAARFSRLSMPCPHCGGAFHEPLTMAAAPPPSASDDRGFRALDAGGPSTEQVEAAFRRVA